MSILITIVSKIFGWLRYVSFHLFHSPLILYRYGTSHVYI